MFRPKIPPKMIRILVFVVVSVLVSRLIGKILMRSFFASRQRNTPPPSEPPRPEGSVFIQKKGSTPKDGFTDYEEIK